MKIAVDAGCLGVRDDRLKTGVFTAASNLLRELVRMDRENTYLLYSFYPIEKDLLLQFGFRARNIVLGPSVLWLTGRLSLEFLRNPPDVFLGFGQSLPIIYPKNSILFIYDLAFEHFPECYPDRGRRLRRQTRFAARRAKKIIAISHATKRDIETLYGIPEEKISVVQLGVGKHFSPRGEIEKNDICRKYGVRRPYFLFVGTRKPIKNTGTLLSAFRLFQKSIPSVHLVLVGSGQKGRERASEENDPSVVRLGWIPEEDLISLYSGALALLQPSLSEGFGLPALEAMASGCPVIASNAGSMPEIVGDAGVCLTPTNASHLRDAMERVVRDSAFRKKMKENGLEQAKKFSWNSAAQKVKMVYTDVTGKET